MAMIPLKDIIQQWYPLFLLPSILLLLTFHRRRPKLNLPPGPLPLPIIGNLHQLRDFPHISFHRLSQKYGPIVHFKLGQVDAIVISSAELALEIMKSQDQVFCSRSQLTAQKRFSYGGKDIAFSPFDHNWKKLRRICNVEIFSPSRIQSLNTIRSEEVRVLVNTISRSCSLEEMIDLSELLYSFFQNSIFQMVFGRRIPIEGEHGRSPVQVLLKDMICIMSEFVAEDMFPSMGWINVFTGWQQRLDKIFEKMDLLIEEEIKKHISKKSNGDASFQHEDFLDVLLHLQADKDDDRCLTMDQVKAIVMDMFIAGMETSPVAIEWGMTQLMKNPTILKKAQAEIRHVVGSKGKVEESDLPHLHYLGMIIKESFRYNPPASLLPPRECMKDTKIGVYDIPSKTRVYVNVWSLGRNQNYWGDDPEVFRPERFEDGSINFKGADFGFLPFGAGRRICPGMSFALVNIELIYASILYEFDWALPNGMTTEDIDMRANFGLTNSRKVPLLLVANPASSPC